ncbi:hypothetical protein, partial [Arcanobacterium phocae]|uniref:hypothetical protein n=1 Tax=Arcanobacterium phocae TaxID=131112 RepID=UPI001C11B596
LPGQHPACGGANIGAVKVQPDALPQVGHHVLGQARVRAGRTGLSALETGLDALGQLLPVDVPQVFRVGLQHRAHVMGHGLLLHRCGSENEPAGTGPPCNRP